MIAAVIRLFLYIIGWEGKLWCKWSWSRPNSQIWLHQWKQVSLLSYSSLSTWTKLTTQHSQSCFTFCFVICYKLLQMPFTRLWTFLSSFCNKRTITPKNSSVPKRQNKWNERKRDSCAVVLSSSIVFLGCAIV